MRIGPYTLLGRIGDCYLILQEENNALVVLDQHAAHERVLFERMERGAAAGRGHSLLLPLELPLHLAERERLAEIKDALSALGFVLEESEMLRVHAVPSMLERGEAAELLREMLSGGKDGPEKLYIQAACKAAVKAGQTLGPDEAARLIGQWLALPADKREFCPHGRPCVMRFGLPELETRFKRRA